ncbi:E3 ubiquitin-protein ligase ATL23-like [Henckelia pumila]|uniref:E3 ubiquitin-protein ligase ATL23-like n=1 Tax=Henckelia pumila TaxID=405737 RepID=UPI003C6DFBF4
MTAVFLVYICLLCYAASTNNGTGNGQEDQFPPPVKPNQHNGLSDSDLEKLPEVTGKDLILGSDCAICLDEIENQQPAKMIPGCNHGFHLHCIHAWLSKQPFCPVCRAKIGSEFFHPPDNDPC